MTDLDGERIEFAIAQRFGLVRRLDVRDIDDVVGRPSFRSDESVSQDAPSRARVREMHALSLEVLKRRHAIVGSGDDRDLLHKE